MALATPLSFSKIRLFLANPATPPLVFVAPCGLNSRSLTRAKGLNDINIPDCDNEDSPAYVGRDVVSISWSIAGEGVLAEEAEETWEDFLESTEAWPIRFEIQNAGALGNKIYTGKGHLANFVIGVERGNKGTVSIDIQGDGKLTRA